MSAALPGPHAGAHPGPHPRAHGQASAVPSPGQGVDEQALEAALSSLAQLDVTEHAAVYEQLLLGLQQELNRSEPGS